MNRQNLVNKIWLSRSNSAFTQGWLLAFQNKIQTHKWLKQMLIYYNNAKLVRILWLSPFSLSPHSLCVGFRRTLIVLASIIYNHSACLSRVFVCVSMRYCHLNTSLFFVYLNHIFFIISSSSFLSSGFGSENFNFHLSLLLFSFSLHVLSPPHPPPPPPPPPPSP